MPLPDTGPRTRCPRCLEVTTPLAVEYTPTREGGIDWREEVYVVCPCGYGYLIGASDVTDRAGRSSVLGLGSAVVGNDGVTDLH